MDAAASATRRRPWSTAARQASASTRAAVPRFAPRSPRRSGPGSTRSKSAMSSTKSGSTTGRPRHNRISIHPATVSSSPPPAAFAAPCGPALRQMCSARGQPAKSSTTAASSCRDSRGSKKRAISLFENRRSSAVTVAARPSRANMGSCSRRSRARTERSGMACRPSFRGMFCTMSQGWPAGRPWDGPPSVHDLVGASAPQHSRLRGRRGRGDQARED